MRRPLPTVAFALVVVRDGDRFLLVREREGNWYLPAGGVEAGETFAAAAVRETREEAGVDVVLEGVLRIEHTPHPSGTQRLRVFFLARPADDRPPKTHADEHSLGAAWFTIAEIRRADLRGKDVLARIDDVLRGAPVAPMTLLADEPK